MSTAIPIEPMADLSQRFRDWSVSTLLKPVSTEDEDPYGTMEVAQELIHDFRDLRKASEEFGIEFRISKVSDDTPDEIPDRVDGADEMLEMVRDTRRALVGAFNRRFLSELNKVNHVVASEFELELNKTLPLFDEFEKLLIAFGAGTDEDAELIMDMIPTADDLSVVA